MMEDYNKYLHKRSLSLLEMELNVDDKNICSMEHEK